MNKQCSRGGKPTDASRYNQTANTGLSKKPNNTGMFMTEIQTEDDTTTQILRRLQALEVACGLFPEPRTHTCTSACLEEDANCDLAYSTPVSNELHLTKMSEALQQVMQLQAELLYQLNVPDHFFQMAATRWKLRYCRRRVKELQACIAENDPPAILQQRLLESVASFRRRIRDLEAELFLYDGR